MTTTGGKQKQNQAPKCSESRTQMLRKPLHEAHLVPQISKTCKHLHSRHAIRGHTSSPLVLLPPRWSDTSAQSTPGPSPPLPPHSLLPSRAGQYGRRNRTVSAPLSLLSSEKRKACKLFCSLTRLSRVLALPGLGRQVCLTLEVRYPDTYCCCVLMPHSPITPWAIKLAFQSPSAYFPNSTALELGQGKGRLLTMPLKTQLSGNIIFHEPPVSAQNKSSVKISKTHEKLF